ncbi:MAG: tRNA (adenosine(37)-N6)-threonylcarbamoyltransferase complex transferase subunit TsaD [Candidatus Yanofskybacteria bacterium RIFCSPHIGHO2_02_FULL_38_22b]|uniref:tRNA N6-adenosine threonylcarbamoyltransferase n=1 Tax=Candidatus Yanofskybacteria bacterium RIFCSPHIGHO2_02_FULL_38_22b TaxID=1802673 RepID=A0A1F8EZJ9_9BACT|nr:MAG: tRNA (adenosine(37)-N6)-threonylcarbamoyltransferase complex transferase subunit TsaD [Candidatus Yanofskybacteria bacterium RIFCSPHIGHO2_01_FULL_39_44]OGN06297.1 MAG: tRNA (adenosine(37)-N6)-threonylcarbamoyltransferase complex transferase subunit TsaD [Candidatus Yanofskybacteria bacterium RIFCSPHIGHO2_02_FULL_38_22b]OGN19788.1 MAG: tRNA (adenosine(37)-N6)-threonylcarbamoyltransferase complex transferase subunit TsaD [Candidatus Yanofskybacteria bacterium RIFCSPLOWO2_01_FULL_39_28]
MRILGIETSCDETAVAIIETSGRPSFAKASAGKQGTRNIKVLSNVISSQVRLHAKYGGVVPNLAAREHVKNIGHVFRLALKQANLSQKSKVKSQKLPIDLIAVTRGPGLGPALLVGIAFAKAVAWKYDKPIIGVNHLEGHIYSNWLKPVGVNSKLQIINYKLPILNLIVSGGHTELVLMEGHGKYKIIGETLDDAVGEAFDKVARLLGLGYPGGPLISKLAEKGDPEHYPLPSPMIYSKNYNFSYSGLKTAVLYLIRDLNLKKLDNQTKSDIAASFQKAAINVLIKKTLRAAKEYGVDSIMLSGGVSANILLRSEFKKMAEENNLKYSRPQIEYTGDNAAMIALTGYMNFAKSPSSLKLRRANDFPWKSLEMDANLGF